MDQQAKRGGIHDASVAKVTVTPSSISWSQAYHAGTLYAVLSLGKTEHSAELDQPLSSLGKDALNTLEEEYFTLEEKSLQEIKKAVGTMYEKLPPGISVSLVVASTVNNVLYVLIHHGKAFLKRDGKVGIILEDVQGEGITTVSGFVQDGDIIVLQTETFSSDVSKSVFLEGLKLSTPPEIADFLTAIIQEKENASSCALILQYTAKKSSFLPETAKEPQLPLDEKQKSFSPPWLPKLPNYFPVLKIIALKPSSLPMQKKIVVGLIGIVVIVFVVSIITATQKQAELKAKAKFNDIYNSAQKQYDQGQQLLTLNKNLANSNFQAAKDTLDKGKTQFKKGSEEEKKLNELLQKVNDGLSASSSSVNVSAKSVDSQNSDFLSYELKNPSIKPQLIAQDDSSIIALKGNDILQTNKSNNQTKTLLSNDSYWSFAKAVGAYLGNIYILDQKTNQIAKLAQSGSSYSKSNYFSDSSKPDLTNSVAVAIDGSIWILFQDGKIKKFTRGNQDSFSLSGLSTPLSKPTRIVTSVDMDLLYVLDPTHKRIVALGKDGVFKQEYHADILASALDFDVLPKDKKMLILSNSKVYQIDLR